MHVSILNYRAKNP
uniref:Uncharacterized protein n=1 Tax=Arundo donax TaxID=35708 RepID=A0A0A9BX48_ARUDO